VKQEVLERTRLPTFLTLFNQFFTEQINGNAPQAEETSFRTDSVSTLSISTTRITNKTEVLEHTKINAPKLNFEEAIFQESQSYLTPVWSEKIKGLRLKGKSDRKKHRQE
jgi:hypothetical protein